VHPSYSKAGRATQETVGKKKVYGKLG